MGRRRTEENLREVILDATERLLGDDPAGLTSRAVQSAAGVSSGTFFHYFPTVDELLLAVAERAAERQPAAFGHLADEGLAAVLTRLFDPDRRDVVLPWLRQRAIGSPQLQRALRRYDERVTADLLAGIRSLLVRAGLDGAIDLEAAVEVVRALAEGFQLRLASDTLAVGPQRFATMAIELILRSATSASSAS